MADAWRSGVPDGSDRAPPRAGEHDAADGPLPAAEGANGEAPPPIVPGNVGSLDDVPADAEGVPVVEE